MLRRTFTLAAVVLALGIWVAPAFGEEEEKKPGTHEGKVVKVDGAKLTMTDKEGKKEYAHVVPATAKITLDGKAATLDQLKPGNKLKVTIEKQDEKVMIVSIEARTTD